MDQAGTETIGTGKFTLPPVPDRMRAHPVAGWAEPVTITTYRPQPPNRLPAFLDRRVYQGSSWRVYPLPFIDRISETGEPVSWQAVHLENRWLRVMVIPELGGRIHVGFDKTTGYDFFHRNEVIKPALVGLAGPWMAGGVEFNWPQHHRPATWLPCDFDIEQEPDGAVTVWCSDHDPFTRMKGMHGIRLHPDRKVIELRVRLYNRDDEAHTFLWWANMAARVNENYQSFFPTDVAVVADHAKRAVTAFPHPDRPYYGIDYAARRDQTFEAGGRNFTADRLDFYRNVPVPTSYMCVGSTGNFFGGYDHGVGAGFVHCADRHLAVGKKQWTWGNDPFGWAWDANLSDDGSHYVELMAGVFTDNQPDFAHIAPGETKVFSQYWFPYAGMGPVQAATEQLALSVDVPTPGRVRIGLAATASLGDCTVVVSEPPTGRELARTVVTPGPDEPAMVELELAGVSGRDELTVVVLDADGAVLLGWRAGESVGTVDAATEPASPDSVATVDELCLIGQHLEQYRHATRSPEPYWLEALRRDPDCPAAATSLAIRHYRRGEYATARSLLEKAIARQTRYNPNPRDGRALYHLGLVLHRLGDDAGAERAWGRALWLREWRAAAGWQLARTALRSRRWSEARNRLEDVLRCEPDHLQARGGLVWLLQRQLPDRANALIEHGLAQDRLDWWLRDLAGQPLDCDAQTCLDLALEYRSIGDHESALRVLDRAREAPNPAGSPAAGAMISLLDGELSGSSVPLGSLLRCHPNRLDEYDLLIRASRAADEDRQRGHHDPERRGRIAALLGTWLYAHDRRDEAIDQWRLATELTPADAVSWRNLGLAIHNGAAHPSGDDRAGGESGAIGAADSAVAEAQRCYRTALELAPEDDRLRYEYDQLAARAGVAPTERLAVLAPDGEPPARDDALVEWAHLMISTSRADEALPVLCDHHFQPWEGGEGKALGVWERCRLRLAADELAAGRAEGAVAHLDAALDPPASLGEERHPLANAAALHLARGDALAATGDPAGARHAWERAAAEGGDFRDMASEPFSEATLHTVLALRRLGRDDRADELADRWREHLDRWAEEPATVDYFATSLPSMLLFTEDPGQAKRIRVLVMRAELLLDAGDPGCAERLLERVLEQDRSHPVALDLRRSSATNRSPAPNPSLSANPDGARGRVG